MALTYFTQGDQTAGMAGRDSRRVSHEGQASDDPASQEVGGARPKASIFDRIEFVMVAASVVLILGVTIAVILWHLLP